MDARPPAASDSPSGVRAACHAGAMPKSTPVRQVRAAAKSATRMSNWRGIPSGISPGGTIAGATRSAIHDNARPAAPPGSASTTLSVRSSRARCRLLAPRAARTAISLARPMPRASNRLATFAQAISRTKATTPPRTSEVDRTSPLTSALRSGSMVTPHPLLVSGEIRAMFCATTSMSLRAWSIVAPGRSRAIT
jgi:hypothetical protein